MACQLWMSDELRDWLTDLAATDQTRAISVAEALTALLSEGALLGPPTVVPVTAPAFPADPFEYLDELYQDSLERVQGIRRRISEMASTRQQLEERVAGLEKAGGPADDQDQLPGLRQQLTRVIEAEQRLVGQGQREQTRVDAYRGRKETLKARLTAARAELGVYADLAELDRASGEADSQDEDLGALAAGAREKLKAVEQEIRQVVSSVAMTRGRAGRGPAPGLMELRADTPGNDEIRFVFAVEPPGSVLLISVLEDRQAWQAHYEEAVSLSSELLLSFRDGEAPEAAARRYDGPPAFLAEFFPADAGRIEAAAADLAARNRGRASPD